MSDNPSGSSQNPYAGYGLAPGQKYKKSQVWGQNPRDIAASTDAKVDDLLAAKMAERDNFQFPYPKPDPDSTDTFAFQPMSMGGGSVMHQGAGPDELFTPLPKQTSAPPTVPSGRVNDDVLRLLLSQLRSNVVQSLDAITAIDTMLAQNGNLNENP